MKDRVAAVQIERNWIVPGLGVGPARGARPRRRSARRAGQLAARQCPGSRGEDRGQRQCRHPAVPADQHVPGVGDGEARTSIPRWSKSGSTSWSPTSSPTARPRTKCGVRRRARSPAGFAASSRSAASAARRSRLPRDKSSSGISDFYKKSLEQYASVTPADIRKAMGQWISRARRSPSGSSRATARPMKRPRPRLRRSVRSRRTSSPPRVKREPPPVGASVPLDFPTIEHVQLSNGVRRRLRPPRDGPGHPARSVVRRRLFGRRARQPRPPEFDVEPAR